MQALSFLKVTIDKIIDIDDSTCEDCEIRMSVDLFPRVMSSDKSAYGCH